MNTPLNFHCPACGAAIVPRLGCHAYSLTQAIQLQALRFGTELFCRECGALHVVLRTDSSNSDASSKRIPHGGFDEADWPIALIDEPEEISSSRTN